MKRGKEARAAARAEKESARLRAFGAQCAALEGAGYAVRDKTLSVGRAGVLGFLASLPFAAAAVAVFFLREHRFLLIGVFWADGLLFSAALFLSVPLHEGLHALIWAAVKGSFCGLSFGVAGGCPYCACGVPLRRGKYLAGVLAPFVLLGAAFCAWGLIAGVFIPLALGVFNIVCAGGDILIAAKAVFCRAKLLLDHPSRCGFFAFYPPENAA